MQEILKLTNYINASEWKTLNTLNLEELGKKLGVIDVGTHYYLEVMECVKFINKIMKIFYDCDTYVIYNHVKHLYERIDSTKMKFIIGELLKKYNESIVSSKNIRNVEELLMYNVQHLMQTQTLSNYIPFSNGDYDVIKIKFYKDFSITKSNVTYSRLNYNYNEKAECPVWERFVDDIFNGDKVKVKRLQELFGYCFYSSDEYPLQKFFIFYGHGRNGKSLCLNILSELVGTRYTSNTPFVKLSTKFGLEALVNKRINISNEIDVNNLIKTDTIKAVTGGDIVEIEPKYKKPYSTRLSCKLIVSTNTQINVSDCSNGYKSRVEVFDFNNSYVPADEDKISKTVKIQDVDLINKLKAELPGIFNWSMKGLIELKENNFILARNIITDEVNNNFLSKRDENIESIKFYIEDNIEYSPNNRIMTSLVYKNYYNWALKINIKPITHKCFHKFFLEYIKNYVLECYKSKYHGNEVYRNIGIK